MLEKTEKKALLYLVGIVASLTSVVISPQLTFDVTNPIKLLILTAGGFASIATLLVYKIYAKNKNYRIINILVLCFFITAVAVFLKSSESPTTQFYGVHGRNTGLLAYVSLLSLLLASVYASNKENLNQLMKFFLITGLISVLYGLLQILDLDPLPWDKAGNWITSFYANPNFFSAFTGMFSGALFGTFFKSSLKLSQRLLLISTFLISLYVMKETGNYQGPAVLVIIVCVVVFLLLRNSKFFKTSFLFLMGVFALVTWAILDLLRVLPWTSLLYKPSVSARGDYWRTSWRIFNDNFLFGVGFDGYRNFEGRYRDLASTYNIDALNYTDASHNVFLDFAVNGGILYLSAYLLLLALTLRSSLRIIRRHQVLDINFVVVFACWIGYLAQSAISFNHLGLAVWGWIFSGTLIGYEIYDGQGIEELSKSSPGRQVKIKSAADKKFLGISFLAGALGGIVALPVYLVNADMWQGIKKQDITIVEAAAYKWPRDVVRMSITAQMLNRVGKNQEALNLLDKAHDVDPQSVIPLKLIYDYLPGDAARKNKVKAEIEKLDPYYFQIVQRAK
jgi:O-antigen ligase